MGSTTFKKYDRNRYRKIYPVNRFPPSLSYRSASQIIMETLSIEFDNEEDKTGTLVELYDALPTIVFSSSTTSKVLDGNVNLWLSALSFNSIDKKVYFTISASAPFTGTVSVKAIVVS